MMRYSLRFEQWVPAPLERTFAFFADPNNLPRITPPELDLRIEQLRIVPPESVAQPSSAVQKLFAGTGSEVTVSFRLPIFGFRMRHLAHITGFELNRSFRDQHSRPPLMDWDHRHKFDAATRGGIVGTIVRDDLRYALGPGFLGAIPNALVVHRQLQKMFQFRHRALDDLVAAGSL
jgi:ligand-binding SRPBCC domain-containing protein